MKMELKEYKLREIADVVNGATPSTTVIGNYDGDVVWITPKDLSVQKAKYIYRGERNITKQGFDSCSTQIIPQGNILMSSRAPIGLLAINQTECCTNQGFKNLVVNKSLCDVEYLYYYLKFHMKEIEKLGSGTTFKEVSKEALSKHSVTLPDLQTQKQVAAVLANIDRKIELNKAINANLEAMAKQLYDYWFVQFDFPDANGRPYKSSGGKMLYNPKLKRDIPEGWEVQELSNLADVRKGDMITSKETTEGKVKVVAGGISFAYYNGRSNRPSNTITVSGSGANAGYINFWREPIFASDCTTINFEDGLDTILCWYGIRLYQNVLFNYAIGAAQPHVYPNHVSSLPMVVIPVSIKEKVRDFFCSANQQIRCNEQELDRLTALRDSLLPMLMNGQVSVL